MQQQQLEQVIQQGLARVDGRHMYNIDVAPARD